MSFNGHFVPQYSLITQNNVRYEGTDPMVSQTQVKLHTVRIFGTENRVPKDSPAYQAPGPNIYSYILFDKHDIVYLDLVQNQPVFNPQQMLLPHGQSPNPAENYPGYLPPYAFQTPQYPPRWQPPRSQGPNPQPMQPSASGLDTKATDGKQGTEPSQHAKPSAPQQQATQPKPAAAEPASLPVTTQQPAEPKETASPAPQAKTFETKVQAPQTTPTPSEPHQKPEKYQASQVVKSHTAEFKSEPRGEKRSETYQPRQQGRRNDQSQQHQRNDQYQQHQRNDQQHQRNDQSQQHQRNDQNQQHQRNDQSQQHQRNDQNQPHQRNDQNQQQKQNSNSKPTKTQTNQPREQGNRTNNPNQKRQEPPEQQAKPAPTPVWGRKGIGAAIVAGTALPTHDFQQNPPRAQANQGQQDKHGHWQAKDSQSSKPQPNSAQPAQQPHQGGGPRQTAPQKQTKPTPQPAPFQKQATGPKQQPTPTPAPVPAPVPARQKTAWGPSAQKTTNSAPTPQQQPSRSLNEMDLEAANALFDKEQYFRELVAGQKQTDKADRDPFFDIGLSTDASSEPKPRGGWQKQREKERKMDEMTFGIAEVSAYEKSLHQPNSFSRAPHQNGSHRPPHGHNRAITQPRGHHK